MASQWQLDKRSSQCEITSVRVKMGTRTSHTVSINTFAFALACDDHDRTAAKRTLGELQQSLGPRLSDAIAALHADADNVQGKGSFATVHRDRVAEETMVRSLFQERLLNNATYDVLEVNWRSFGLMKEKEHGSCMAVASFISFQATQMIGPFASIAKAALQTHRALALRVQWWFGSASQYLSCIDVTAPV